MSNPEDTAVCLVGELASSSTYDQAFLGCSDGYCVFDGQNLLVAYSSTFPTLYPSVEDDIHLGLSYSEYLYLFASKKAIQNLGDTPDVDAWVSALVETKKINQSFIHHLQDGRWMEIKQLKVGTGETLFIAFDISDLLLQRDELLANQQKFQTFASLASDWYWELDENLVYLYHSNHRTPMSQRVDSPDGIEADLQKQSASRVSSKGYPLMGNGIDLPAVTQASDLSGVSRIESMNARIVHDEEFDRHNKCLTNHLQVDVVLTWLDDYERKVYSHVRAEPQFNENGDFTGYIGCGRDVTDYMMLAQQLERHANYDHLTGALNKRAFELTLEQKVDELSESTLSFVLCLIDLDHFKAVNDESGHAAGDYVLKKLGLLLRKSFSDHAIVGRIGGDEFGLLLRGDRATVQAELVELIDKISVMKFEGKGKIHQIGASIGATCLKAGLDSRELLSQADQACYEAKNAGKGCVRFYHESFVSEEFPSEDSALEIKSEFDNRRASLPNGGHRSKPLIAIIYDQSTFHQNRLSSAITDTLKDFDMHTIDFIVEGPTNVGPSNHNRGVYNQGENVQLEQESVDGVIALTGSIGKTLNTDNMQQIVDACPDIPVVSIGPGLTGCDVVRWNEEDALGSLLELLIQSEQDAIVSYIRGYPENPDSANRETLLREMLSLRNVPINEDLFVTGNFLESDAYSEVEVYLKRGIFPDLVISASANMAEAAARAIDKYQSNSSKKTLVTSFETLGSVALSDSVFATIRTPIVTLATAAAKIFNQKWTRREDNETGSFVQKRVNCTLHVSPSSELQVQTIDYSVVLSKIGVDSGQPTVEMINKDFVATFELLEGDDCKKLFGMEPTDRLPCHMFSDYVKGTDKSFEKVVSREDFPVDRNWAGLNILSLLVNLLGGYVDSLQSDIQCEVVCVNLIRLINRLTDKRDKLKSELEFTELKQRQEFEKLGYKLLEVKTIEEVCLTLDDGLRPCGITRSYLVLNERVSNRNAGNRLVYAFDGSSNSTAVRELVRNSELLPNARKTDLFTGLLKRFPLSLDGVESGCLYLDSEVDPVATGNLAKCIVTAINNCFRTEENERKTQQLREINTELARQTNHDPITGLPNYEQFVSDLDKSTQVCDRRSTRTALVKINLVDFKLLVNSCGVSNVGYLLRMVAMRLFSDDTANVKYSRIGESEFAAIFELGLSDTKVDEWVQVLLEKMSDPFEISGSSISLRVAIGIAYYPEHGTNVDSLVANADAAARYSVVSGQAAFTTFSASMENSVLNQWQLDQDMRKALVEGDFYLVYQPKVDIASGLINSFEALLRWKSDLTEGREGRKLATQDFISIAEQTGLIKELSDFVISAACSQLAQWKASGLSTRVSINLSTLDLSSDDLSSRVLTPLEEHGLHPTALTVEITETAAMGDIETAINRLEELRAKGIEVAIDDFGTSYSSLNYLKRLPATHLKIDQSFVKDISEDLSSPDIAIIGAIVALGHNLGCKVVAEGVETAEQYDCLRDLNCDEIQGYFFSAPVSADDAEQLLLNQSGDRTKAA